VRGRVLSRLLNIDTKLANRVADGLGWRDPVEAAPAAAPTRTDLPSSPALSILAKAKPTLDGRMVGCLVSDGADPAVVKALRGAVEKARGQFKIVAPKVGGVTGGDGQVIEADFQLAGGPSVLFDAVALVVSADGATALVTEAAAKSFVADAFAHLKVIGYTEAAAGLLKQAGIATDADAGVVALSQGAAGPFVQAAQNGRIWDREPTVRQVH